MTAQGGKSVAKRRLLSWALWGCVTLAAGLGLARRMVQTDASREFFLPGKTTHGHYQIELSCESCHTEQFSSTADFQAACVGCHEAELSEAQDSHPETKFTDPRNAERILELDARYCITCHSEHQPERTQSMGLSLPEDYCYRCHQEIGEERPSHKDLAFDTCASSGCHNFHDNRALYEDYLVRHGNEPALLAEPFRVLKEGEACPSPLRKKAELADLEKCAECHERETTSYKSGLHGMRLAQGMTPMDPKMARLPMKSSSFGKQLSCQSCHAPAEDVSKLEETPEVETCLTCHDDNHSKAYKGSKHYQMWQLEQEGRVAKGSGVTCSTCHMPRQRDEDGNLWVNHNQNHNLRPNEKMVREVCGNCHGLPFAIDALADSSVVDSAFSVAPTRHVKSVDWALARN